MSERDGTMTDISLQKTAKTAKRARGRPFPKGQSGNPAGVAVHFLGVPVDVDADALLAGVLNVAGTSAGRGAGADQRGGGVAAPCRDGSA